MKRSRPYSAALIALAAALLFAWLARAVASSPAARFDLAVRGAVHAWASPQITFVMRGFTMLGSETVLVPLGVLLSWRWIATGRWRFAALLAVAALGGEAWDQALKQFFHRARPEAFFGFPLPGTYSFPSGHSMASFCFYGAVAMIAIAQVRSGARRWAIGVGVAALALMVGFSRIYLGVHYPTDVIGGYLAGVAWLSVIRWRMLSLANLSSPSASPDDRSP